MHKLNLLKGHMIRSRIKWLDKVERPTKYFCSLANSNNINKTIKRLTSSDNCIILDQKETLEEFRIFYEN